MGKVVVITEYFDVWDIHGYPTGEKEFLVSHGIDTETMETIPLPGVLPDELGATYDSTINEWVLEN